MARERERERNLSQENFPPQNFQEFASGGGGGRETTGEGDTYTHTHTHTHTDPHTHRHTHTPQTPTQTHLHTHIHTHRQGEIRQQGTVATADLKTVFSAGGSKCRVRADPGTS